VIQQMREPAPLPVLPALPVLDDEAQAQAVTAAVDGIAAEPASVRRAPAELYQDFLIRCRMSGMASAPLDLTQFRRRLLMARAGVANDDEEWSEALALASLLPEEMLGAFLLVARAAREGAECPSNAALAEVYGTSSLGRVRRMLGYMEEQEVIVARTDLSGRRSISLPRLGWTTSPAFPDPDQPSRLARPARRR
jgi:hypothetical protein